WEVGPRHSSCEAGEQSGAPRCGGLHDGASCSGGGGAKGGDQGECGAAPHALDTAPGSLATGAGPHAASTCMYGSVRGALSNERPYRVRRREVITLLGGTAAAWPLAVQEKIMTMRVRSLVFAAAMAALLTTAAHAQLSQAWKICEGYM